MLSKTHVSLFGWDTVSTTSTSEAHRWYSQSKNKSCGRDGEERNITVSAFNTLHSAFYRCIISFLIDCICRGLCLQLFGGSIKYKGSNCEYFFGRWVEAVCRSMHSLLQRKSDPRPQERLPVKFAAEAIQRPAPVAAWRNLTAAIKFCYQVQYQEMQR